MKIVNRFKRIIAGLLSVVIMITIIPDISVYAETEEFSDFEKGQIDSEVDEEIELESRYDMQYGNNWEDWKQAIFVDLLSWNSFHNAVQQHIRDTNEGFLDTELYLEYTDIDNNKK